MTTNSIDTRGFALRNRREYCNNCQNIYNEDMASTI